MLVYFLSGIQLEQSGRHLINYKPMEIDRMAEKSLKTARIRRKKGFSVATEDMYMNVCFLR